MSVNLLLENVVMRLSRLSAPSFQFERVHLGAWVGPGWVD